MKSNQPQNAQLAMPGCLARLVMRLRSGWLPWWLRWPVMLAQVALLPIAIPAEFIWLVWERGGAIAWDIFLDGMQSMPSDFWACWTGKRRLWGSSHNSKL